MRLEHQNPTGTWTDCAERTEKFLARCEAETGAGRDEVLSALATGTSVQSGSEWYSNCRDGEVIDARRAAKATLETVRCDCGHTVHAGNQMSGDDGTCCPDCYERTI